MSKKKKPATRRSSLEQQFKASEGELCRQLTLAIPIARQSLWNDGLDIDNCQLENVEQLAGSNDRFNKLGDEGWFACCRHIEAAFALGVALGQLVHLDVFKTGGAR